MKRLTLLCCFCMLCCFGTLSACAEQTSPSDTANGQPVIDFPGGQAPLNQVFSFTVDVGDRKLVSVNADMPSHGHGINTQPEWNKQDDGTWQVDGMLLHMPGAWELYFDVIESDGAERRLVVPLELDFE